MASKEIVRLILKGDCEGLRTFLDTSFEEGVELDYEPYTMIQRKAQVDALKVLMDDPRFTFDDRFVGRMFYFSTGIVQRAVWEHPRMKKILEGSPSMTEYFYRRYPNPTWKQSAGIGQRYFRADSVIDYLRREDAKKKNQRLVFFLYPALRRFIHLSLERQYAPGGSGFYRGKNEFMNLVGAHT